MLLSVHTCFFALDLPMYSSQELTKQKLLYAITHCTAIDADDTSVARAAIAGGMWLDDDED